ncbi:MAG TPA: Ig-like domain-containing protein [Steroidobacteraceae bacterium]|nr:Ig-like domain-containing protein [Steroidobacteraceae bacterium]
MRGITNNYLALKGILIIPALLLAGCTAGNGKGLDENGGVPPVTPPGASEFQQIQDTIFTPICTNCHVGATAPQGLRLDAANSYAALVNVASSEVPGTLRVNPGNPDLSYIVQKLEGNQAVGARMPFGGPYLSQTQIDLVRTWIAAGAPPPPPAASNKLIVASTIPAAAEIAAGNTDRLTVIFSAAVDASLVSTATFELLDGFDAPVALAGARVATGRPNVVELTLTRPLPAGSYQLNVRGAGPVALADNAGHVLDGDADGVAGGDYLMSFDVSAGAVR